MIELRQQRAELESKNYYCQQIRTSEKQTARNAHCVNIIIEFPNDVQRFRNDKQEKLLVE